MHGCKRYDPNDEGGRIASGTVIEGNAGAGAEPRSQGSEKTVFPCLASSKNARQNKIFLYNAQFFAGVAQLVEQLICNQPVAGSSPISSSKEFKALGANLRPFLLPKEF